MFSNICLKVSILSGCNWKKALDEAKALSIALGIPIKVTLEDYNFQWLVTKDTDLTNLKNDPVTNLVFGTEHTLPPIGKVDGDELWNRK